MTELIWKQGLDQLPDAARIRREVFVQEQGFEHEFDEIDSSAIHVVAYVDGEPAATGRTYRGEDSGFVIGRIAVRRAYRGCGWGMRVVEKLEELALQQGGRRAELLAQVRAQGFYEKLGYAAVGGVVYDEFCPHVRMTKALG